MTEEIVKNKCLNCSRISCKRHIRMPKPLIHDDEQEKAKIVFFVKKFGIYEVVMDSEDAFRFLTAKQKDNKELCVVAALYGTPWKEIPDKYRYDKDVILATITSCPLDFVLFDFKIKTNKTYAKYAMKQDARVYYYLDDSIKHDEDILSLLQGQ